MTESSRELPQFLKAPKMCGVILEILHLHPDYSPGRGSVVVIVRVLDGKEVGRERRVESVGHQHELERHFLLQLHRDGVGLLQAVNDVSVLGALCDITLRKTAFPQRSSLRDVNW